MSFPKLALLALVGVTAVAAFAQQPRKVTQYDSRDEALQACRDWVESGSYTEYKVQSLKWVNGKRVWKPTGEIGKRYVRDCDNEYQTNQFLGRIVKDGEVVKNFRY